MRVFAVYTAGRLLVLALVAAVLYLVGLRGFVLVLLALLLSLPLSYLLLARQRAALSDEIERRVEARRARRDELRMQLRGDEEPTD